MESDEENGACHDLRPDGRDQHPPDAEQRCSCEGGGDVENDDYGGGRATMPGCRSPIASVIATPVAMPTA